MIACWLHAVLDLPLDVRPAHELRARLVADASGWAANVTFHDALYLASVPGVGAAVAAIS
jgi:hypothetical protein